MNSHTIFFGLETVGQFRHNMRTGGSRGAIQMCPECPSAQLNCQIPCLVDPFMAVVQTQACAMGDNPDVPLEKQLHKFRQLDGSP